MAHRRTGPEHETQKLEMQIRTGARQALKRIAVHEGVSMVAVVERLVLAEEARIRQCLTGADLEGYLHPPGTRPALPGPASRRDEPEFGEAQSPVMVGVRRPTGA